MIQEKLQDARVALQEKKLKKSGKNKFAGFTYFELADFLPTINKLFNELKLFSNFSIKDGLATLTVTDWEDNTKEIFTSPIEELELKGCTKVQALGGIHTYLKRYLYLNALEIIESDMLDAQAGNIEEKPTTKKKPEKKLPSDKDMEFINELVNFENKDDLKGYYDLTKEQVDDRENYHKLVLERLKILKEVK